MNNEQALEVLNLAYTSGEAISVLETEDGVKYTGVSLTENPSHEVSDSVERISGSDAAGTKIAVDIYYTPNEEVDRLCLRRGYTRSLVGTISRIVT
jgi:hypothetical protein